MTVRTVTVVYVETNSSVCVLKKVMMLLLVLVVVFVCVVVPENVETAVRTSNDRCVVVTEKLAICVETPVITLVTVLVVDVDSIALLVIKFKSIDTITEVK